MAIKTTCDCGFSFNAKDELAGKRVKCPRCDAALRIPDPKSAGAKAVGSSSGDSSTQSGGGGNRSALNQGLLALLDEEGVEGIPDGPICPSCGQVMSASSVICVNCGYNTATGEFLETEIEGGEGEDRVRGSSADQLMAKAEEDIEHTPVTAVDQDFGDGADSYVVALAAAAIMGILILAGLSIVFIMEYATTSLSSATIGLWAGLVILAASEVMVMIAAFRESMVSGLLCLIVPYTVYYGFSKGGALLLPSILMLIAIPVTLISFAVM